jgi:hypothetical protein
MYLQNIWVQKPTPWLQIISAEANKFEKNPG